MILVYFNRTTNYSSYSLQSPLTGSTTESNPFVLRETEPEKKRPTALVKYPQSFTEILYIFVGNMV